MIHVFAVIMVMLAGFLVPVAAQRGAVVDVADIERLEDAVYLAGHDLASLRARDAVRADSLAHAMAELQDEVIYLKIKLRKERSVTRREYADVRDRIEGLRTNARTALLAARPRSLYQPHGTSVPPVVEVPVGTEMDVRLTHSLDSGSAAVEDRFEATTLADVYTDGRVAIPAGSVVRGVVTTVEPATRTNRTARLTMSFDQVTVNGRAYPMRGTVTEAIEGTGLRGEAGRIGAGAGAGALIGGLLGGVKGALAGLAIGGAGTIAATEGKDVQLPQGSVLRVRFDSPVEFDVRR